MHIALATCRDLPEWEVDDAPLHRALIERGVTLLQPAWDDATFPWHEVEACLIRTTWDYPARREAYVAWAERIALRTRLYNPAGIVRWNTDKSYLRDLASFGIAVIPTIRLERGSIDALDPAPLLRERGWPRAFLKPVVGSAARNTLRFDADPEGLALAHAHLAAHLPHRAFLLQPYLATVETFGEVSAIRIDGDITHAVRKVPMPGDYRVQDDYGARDEPYAFAPDELAMIDALFARIGRDLLYGRADFLRDDAGRLLLTELELTEPSLFFRHHQPAADRLAEALLARIARDPKPIPPANEAAFACRS